MHEDNNKIKVCFVMPKTYPLFNPNVDKLFGGAEVDLYYLSTELAKDDSYSVSFIVADYGQPATEEIENVKLFKSLSFKENPLSAAGKIWKAMKLADADFYILKTISLGVILAWLFCAIHKSALTYRFASSRECDGTYRRKHPIIWSLFRFALKRAMCVFVQNNKDAENLKKQTGLNSVVLPNGHRLTEVNTSEKDIILWVGRSAPIKRPEYFIDIARYCPGQNFVMICQRATGDQNYNQLKERVRDIANLKFIERVNFNEINNYFVRAKALVNTSDSEGFPNAFIQACTASVPVISLNVNPDGFLDKYKCGICYNSDLKAMSDAIADIDTVLSAESQNNMGANALDYVRQNHDISNLVKKYKELFETVKK